MCKPVTEFTHECLNKVHYATVWEVKQTDSSLAFLKHEPAAWGWYAGSVCGWCTACFVRSPMLINAAGSEQGADG